MKLTVNQLCARDHYTEACDYLSAISLSERQGKDGGNKTITKIALVSHQLVKMYQCCGISPQLLDFIRFVAYTRYFYFVLDTSYQIIAVINFQKGQFAFYFYSVKM